MMNERVSDIVERAGGVNKNGYSRGGTLTRDDQRMRINMEEALENRGGKFDAVLSPGDLIRIPAAPSSILVVGEVNNPGLYTYVRNESRNFYIDQAGGLTDSADFALIEYPEGYVEKTRLSWAFGSNPSIPDGSTIRVVKVIPPLPEKTTSEKKTTFVEVFREISAIIATTLTIMVLANQLK